MSFDKKISQLTATPAAQRGDLLPIARYNGSTYDNFYITNQEILDLIIFGNGTIIGGNFDTNPWQRGTVFSGLTASTNRQYTADQFFWLNNTGSGAVTVQQILNDAPTTTQVGFGCHNSCGLQVTTSATPGSFDYYLFGTALEGYNWNELLGDDIVISFWAKFSLAGTYCVSLLSGGFDYSYVAEYTITTPNVWQYVTCKITVPTPSANFGKANDLGVLLFFCIASGSNFKTTPNIWRSGQYYATNNQTNGMSSTSNSFQFDLFQIEKGDVATPFKFRNACQEFQLCQRYYEKSYNFFDPPGSVINAGLVYNIFGFESLKTLANFVKFAVPKRTYPTITTYDNAGAQGYVSRGTLNGQTPYIPITSLNSFICGSAIGTIATSQVSFHFTADASL